jgi:hypothetical protein
MICADFMAASGMAGQGQGLVQQTGLAGNTTMYSYNSAATLQQQQFAQQQLMQNQVYTFNNAMFLFVCLFFE